MKISFSCFVFYEEVVVIELCSGADVILVELSSRQKTIQHAVGRTLFK